MFDDLAFLIRVGNGDSASILDGDGDMTLDPWPTRPGVATAYNPALTVTLPATVRFTSGANSVTATGPGTGDATYSTYTAFADPDSVVVNANGTTTLTWSSAADIPHSPDHDLPSSYREELRLRLNTTVVATTGSTLVKAVLDVEDALGNPSRGSNSGEPFTYREESLITCGTQPVPQHTLRKYPDVPDKVEILPGGLGTYTIVVNQNRDEDITDPPP